MLKNACASWQVGSPGVDDLNDHLEGTTTFTPHPSTRLHHWGSFLGAKKGCCSFILYIKYAHQIQKGVRFLPVMLIQQSMNLAPHGRDTCYSNFLFSTPILQWKRKKTPFLAIRSFCTSYFALVHIPPSLAKDIPHSQNHINRYVSVLSTCILILYPTDFTFGPLIAFSRRCWDQLSEQGCWTGTSTLNPPLRSSESVQALIYWSWTTSARPLVRDRCLFCSAVRVQSLLWSCAWVHLGLTK